MNDRTTWLSDLLHEARAEQDAAVAQAEAVADASRDLADDATEWLRAHDDP